MSWTSSPRRSCRRARPRAAPCRGAGVHTGRRSRVRRPWRRRARSWPGCGRRRRSRSRGSARWGRCGRGGPASPCPRAPRRRRSRTSRPTLTGPRGSKRAGSSSVTPASRVARARRGECTASTSASCTLVVDAEHLVLDADQDALAPEVTRARATHHVGEVVLALRVVVGQLRKPAHSTWWIGRGGHDAGVDSRGCGAAPRRHPSVRRSRPRAPRHRARCDRSRWDRQLRLTSPPPAGPAPPSRRCSVLAANQRHVTVEHQHRWRRPAPVAWPAPPRVPFPVGRVCSGPLQVGLVSKGGTYLLAAVPVHHVDAVAAIQRARAAITCRKHRLARRWAAAPWASRSCMRLPSPAARMMTDTGICGSCGVAMPLFHPSHPAGQRLTAVRHDRGHAHGPIVRRAGMRRTRGAGRCSPPADNSQHRGIRHDDAAGTARSARCSGFAPRPAWPAWRSAARTGPTRRKPPVSTVGADPHRARHVRDVHEMALDDLQADDGREQEGRRHPTTTTSTRPSRARRTIRTCTWW